MTYNIAVSGTTLDNHITNSYPVPATEQIYQRFMPKYAEAFWTPWSRNDTLFIMFVGINDVMIMNPVTGPALADIDSRLENIHFKLLSSLYGTGARNFLLLNVPPLERTWHAPRTEQGVIDKHGSDARGKFKVLLRSAPLWELSSRDIHLEPLTCGSNIRLLQSSLAT